MRNSSGRYYVSVEIEGRTFSRSEGVCGAPFDPTSFEEWNCQTWDGRDLQIIFLYGIEFSLDGKRIAYFGDPGLTLDGKNVREKQRVQYCNLFRKITGFPFNKVSRALHNALDDYRQDPMGCLEDYE